MDYKLKIHKLLESESIITGYTEYEIKAYENENQIRFPSDYKSFLKEISKAKCKSEGTFILPNGREIFGFGEFLSFDDNKKRGYTEMFTKDKVAIEDYDKLYRFGDSGYGFSQFFYIGIKEPFIDKIFVWHFEEDSEEESILSENGMLLYPKQLVANSFIEFINFLIENLNNNRIGY